MNTILDYLDPNKQDSEDTQINIFMRDIVPVIMNFWRITISDVAKHIEDGKVALGGIQLEVDYSHLDMPDSLDFQLYYFEEIF